MGDVVSLTKPAADQIQALHEKIVNAENKALEWRMQAGRMLIETREECQSNPDGPTFEQWCKDNIPYIPRRTYQRYIVDAGGGRPNNSPGSYDASGDASHIIKLLNKLSDDEDRQAIKTWIEENW